MGEARKAVFNVGSPAVTGLKDVVEADDAAVAKLGLDPAEAFLVLLQHPAGGTCRQEQQAMAATLDGTDRWQRLVLAPNDDPGRQGVVDALRAAGIRPIRHLKRTMFLSALRRASALVGNSSAGLIEAAAMRVPVVNVGSRQRGRERPGNVLDSPLKASAIRSAARRAMLADLQGLRHPYGDGRTPTRIAHVLAQFDTTSISPGKQNTY